VLRCNSTRKNDGFLVELGKYRHLKNVNAFQASKAVDNYLFNQDDENQRRGENVCLLIDLLNKQMYSL
jgi:hypothetical protein